jgi:hypothetical protein
MAHYPREVGLAGHRATHHGDCGMGVSPVWAPYASISLGTSRQPRPWTRCFTRDASKGYCVHGYASCLFIHIYVADFFYLRIILQRLNVRVSRGQAIGFYENDKAP